MKSLSLECKILDAIEYIESSKKTIAPITHDGKLIGIISDGDIRRGMISGENVDSSVQSIMRSSPLVVYDDESEENIKKIFEENNIEAIPIIDKNDQFVTILHNTDLFPSSNQDEYFLDKDLKVLVLAGGKGERLLPITKDIPKVLVNVGDKPILERIIINLKNLGLRSFFLSINHLGKMVEDHFKDGSRLDINIKYLKEDKKLGTAGPIGLMDDFDDLLVINGDVLTDVDYISMFKYHKENAGFMTIGASNYHVNIPYGVLEISGGTLNGIKEKPSEYFLCSAGIYILSSKVRSFVPENEYFDMNILIEKIISKGKKINVFPIHENWIDIGNKNQLEKARTRIKKGN